jgi:hypothetical protein
MHHRLPLAQVSHHVHCNDEAFDEDVFSAFPLLRFDARLPRKWYHKYQHIYMWIAFPFLQLAFQVSHSAQQQCIAAHSSNFWQTA